MKKSLLTLCVALCFCETALAQRDPDAPPVHTYCCDDGSGSSLCRTHQLASSCRGKAYKIIDPNGNVLKRVAAHEVEKEKEEEKTASERKKEEYKSRSDQALLETYYSEDEIVIVQKRQEKTLRRNIKKIEERLANAQAKKDKLQKQRKKLTAAGEPVPQSLRVQLKAAEEEEILELALLESKTQELEETNLKFEEDRLRWRELNKQMQEIAAKEEAARRQRMSIWEDG